MDTRNIELPINQIICGNSLSVMQTWPEDSVDCAVTSPPYYGLRTYKVEGQLGLEPTLTEYLDNLVKVFREVKRILKPQGTFWLNIANSYCTTAAGNKEFISGIMSHCSPDKLESFAQHKRNAVHRMTGGTKSFQPVNTMFVTDLPKRNVVAENWVGKKTNMTHMGPVEGYKNKDLLPVAWLLALALQKDGWWLRSDIIWSKPNPMPESVTDRCTKAHEYLFLLTKSADYFFDAESIKEDSVDVESYTGRRFRGRHAIYESGAIPDVAGQTINSGKNINLNKKYPKRNKRDVWTIAVNKPRVCKNHFAVFPEKLVEPCLLAGCPTGGIVLDCFLGSGTVCVVAKRLNRNYIGIDISEKFCQLANNRVNQTERSPW